MAVIKELERNGWKVLIVPLWNWNTLFGVDRFTLPSVLIVPLWNWNSFLRLLGLGINGSNRTFMELKFEIAVPEAKLERTF